MSSATRTTTGFLLSFPDKANFSWRCGVAVALTLVMLAEASRQFTVGGLPMSPLWPPAGIFVATVALFGYRILIYLIPAMLGWSLWLEGTPVIMAVLAVTGQAVGASVAALLLHRFWERNPARKPFREMVGVYFYAALLGGGLTALAGAIGYRQGIEHSLGFAFHDLWLVYWSFEAFGVILFAPVTYMLLRSPDRFGQQLLRDWRRPALWLWLSATMALVSVAVGFEGFQSTGYASALGFCFFPLLSWFILQSRAATVLIAIPVFVAVFMTFSIHGLAGFPAIQSITDMMRSLLLVGGLVVMAHVLAAAASERTQLAKGFERQAVTDYLTGLNNDRGLSRRMDAILKKADSGKNGYWLVYLTVLEADRIEDLLGFEDSQKLEQRLSAMIRDVVEPDSYIARIGDATYVVLINESDSLALNEQLNRIYDSFDRHMLAPGHRNVQIRIAIGAVSLDGSLADHAHYLSAATEATLQAGQKTRKVTVVENARELIEQRQATSFQMERLKSALSDNRLELYAQRIEPFAASDNQALYYEILIRLREPDSSLVGPGGFLPVAETFGFMLEIDQWVIRTTLETLATNPDWLARTARCAINLAGSSLSSRELADFIDNQLSLTGVPPDRMSFEITETQQISHRETAIEQVRAIRALGCHVSLDDFGTGLATFDYLRSFDLDYVKIDGVFVRELLANEQDRSMVRAICEVASTMGLETIAEFVENREVADALIALGVDYGQGFGIARPAPLRELFEQPPVH